MLTVLNLALSAVIIKMIKAGQLKGPPGPCGPMGPRGRDGGPSKVEQIL